MNENLKKDSEKRFKGFKQNANEKDIDKINSKISNMNKGSLRDVWDNVMALWKLMKDPNAGWSSKVIAIGSLLYVVSPIDVIPDIIPVVGLTDDAAVVALAIAKLGSEIKKYS